METPQAPTPPDDHGINVGFSCTLLYSVKVRFQAFCRENNLPIGVTVEKALESFMQNYGNSARQ